MRYTIEQHGFALLPAVFSRSQVAGLLEELQQALDRRDSSGAIRGKREQLVASRNVMQLWPQVVAVARVPAIRDMVQSQLGTGCGLVRTLYFDKPPERSWSLPWHKDMTIAVREHRLGGTQFCNPTIKAGVPHVEAPLAVLDQMLTARIHLDDVTEENGPLLVIPGSHHDTPAADSQPEKRPFYEVHTAAGDVLLMRPLLTHSSRKSLPGTQRHRRIIHLEFAARAPLPEGYEWFEFAEL